MVCREDYNHHINILVDTSRIINQVMSVVCLNISLSVTHIEGDASHLPSLKVTEQQRGTIWSIWFGCIEGINLARVPLQQQFG